MEAWSFIPQRGFTESLEWLTDVMRCKGQEQRLALRAAPRLGFQYDYIMSPLQFARAKAMARANSGEEFYLPLWGEVSYLGSLNYGDSFLVFDTRFRRYQVGGSLIVWQDEVHFEIAEILSVTDGQIDLVNPLQKGPYIGALVAPVKPASFSQPFEVTRSASDFVKASARFEVVESDDLSGYTNYPSYKGHEVVTDRNFIISDVRDRIQRELVDMDNSTGVVWRGPQFSYPSPTSSMGWDVLSREELWDLRRRLHTKRGRWQGFWLPSWNYDLQVVSNIVSTSNQVVVKSTGYPRFESERDVVVVGKDGSLHYLQIDSAVTYGGWGTLYGEAYGSDEDYEILTLSTNAGFNMAAEAIEAVCFMSFNRFDADRVEIKHRDAGAASVAIPVREVPLV